MQIGSEENYFQVSSKKSADLTCVKPTPKLWSRIWAVNTLHVPVKIGAIRRSVSCKYNSLSKVLCDNNDDDNDKQNKTESKQSVGQEKKQTHIHALIRSNHAYTEELFNW